MRPFCPVGTSCWITVGEFPALFAGPVTDGATVGLHVPCQS